MAETGTLKPLLGKDSIPLSKLPASVRRLLEETPSKEWYKIRAFIARYEESVELTLLIPIVDRIMDVAPARCIEGLMRNTITPQALDGGFRRIRDAINAVKDACWQMAKLAQMDFKVSGPVSDASAPAPPKAVPQAAPPVT